MAAVFGAVMLVMRVVRLEGQRGGGGDLPVGERAPAFRLDDAGSGAPLELASLAGRPVILAFWGTYCPSCRDELPALDAVAREAEGRYAVVSLSAEDPERVRAFLAKRALAFPVLMDLTGATFEAYRVESVPKTVILDRHGAIVHDFTGPADADILREHMERLAGG